MDCIVHGVAKSQTQLSDFHFHLWAFRCGIWALNCSVWGLVPWPSIKLGFPALGVWNLSHWTTREVPKLFLKFKHWFFGHANHIGGFVVQSLVVSDSPGPCGLQHTCIHCFPEFAQTHVQWCYLAISSSAVPFSFCPQSFPASGSFPISQLFASDGQSIGTTAPASVLPMNTQGWFPFWVTALTSLQCKGLRKP